MILNVYFWLHLFIFSDEDESDSDEGPSCAICMTEYEEGDKLRVLPCDHEFHIDCVDKWLRLKKVCPLCRHDISRPMPSNENNENNDGQNGNDNNENNNNNSNINNNNDSSNNNNNGNNLVNGLLDDQDILSFTFHLSTSRFFMYKLVTGGSLQ